MLFWVVGHWGWLSELLQYKNVVGISIRELDFINKKAPLQ